MADEVGVKINGRLYPIPTGFSLGEGRTIKRMTVCPKYPNGMSPVQFSKELEKLAETQDSDVIATFVWYCMHREDPNVTQEDADRIDYVELEFVGQAPPAKQEDKPDDPPVTGGRLSHESPAAKPEPSEPSAPLSNEEQDVSWAKTPVSTGLGG